MSGRPSPTGRYEITTRDHEAFNTHWVMTPAIRDTQSGETVFDFESTQWSLDEAQWRGDSVVRFTLRKYPGNHRPGEVVALIDCETRTATVGQDSSAELPSIPLAELEARLDRELTWIYAEPEPDKPAPGLLAALQRLLRGK